MDEPGSIVDRRRIACFILVGAIGLAMACFLDADPTSRTIANWVWPFVFGAGLFCVYAPAFAGRIRVRDRISVDVAVFGVSFAFWGSALVPLMGGFYGFVHALICTLFLRLVLRSWWVVPAPVLLLIPAWIIASAAFGALKAHLQFLGMTTNHSIAVFSWNAMMFAWLAGVARLVQRRRGLLPPMPCENCGYSLLGLNADRCPECGTPFDDDLKRSEA